MEQIKEDIVNWIRDFFEENGKGCNAVVGISGGVDSSVVAALCVEALGSDRVIGVLMPQNKQSDIADSYELCNFLGISRYVINIGNAVESLQGKIAENALTVSEQTKINLPPRVRMATLYAVSQSVNGRVANTCNLSEDWVGFNTRYGDSVGDFSPLSNLTKTEVKDLAHVLHLPENLANKTPIDGLCGKTDEESFGFTYEVLDKYIRTGKIDDEKVKAKIDAMHNKNLFKLLPMPTFPFQKK